MIGYGCRVLPIQANSIPGVSGFQRGEFFVFVEVGELAENNPVVHGEPGMRLKTGFLAVGHPDMQCCVKTVLGEKNPAG